MLLIDSVVHSFPVKSLNVFVVFCLPVWPDLLMCSDLEHIICAYRPMSSV